MINLVKTDNFIKQGITMKKMIDSGYSGFLTYKPPTYTYKLVLDLEKAVLMTNEGWEIDNLQSFSINLSLNIYRDLKESIKSP